MGENQPPGSEFSTLLCPIRSASCWNCFPTAGSNAIIIRPGGVEGSAGKRVLVLKPNIAERKGPKFTSKKLSELLVGVVREKGDSPARVAQSRCQNSASRFLYRAIFCNLAKHEGKELHTVHTVLKVLKKILRL